MPVVELSRYSLPPEGAGNGLNDVSFSLSKGEACSLQTDSVDDAALLLKAVATLRTPHKGAYYFNGQPIDLSNYRNALPCKQRIGYIAATAALISNRTVRENLLLMRSFHEDCRLPDLDERMFALCCNFGIIDKLDQRPAELHPRDMQTVIVVREISKHAEVLVLDRPEDFIDHTKSDLFKETVKSMNLEGLPVVFYSSDAGLTKSLANRTVDICKGRLRTGGSQVIKWT